MPEKALWFASVCSRNVVPLGGVLLLGWNAQNVLLLYFVDTVLTMLVIFAGLAGAFLPTGNASGRRHFAKGAAVGIPVMILIVAITLHFVLGKDFDWRTAIDDPQLRIGVVWQAIAALWSCRDLMRDLRKWTPEQLRLERRCGLVLGRWLSTAFVAVIFGDRFGAYGPVVLVAAYVVQSIWIEVAPHHFFAGMPDDIDEKRSGKNAARARDDVAQRRRKPKR